MSDMPNHLKKGILTGLLFLVPPQSFFTQEKREQPEEENDNEEDEDEDKAAKEPKTKPQLYAMFNKHGPTSMVAGFMSDHSLQNAARIVIECTQPLEDAYYKALESASGGWHAQAAFAAQRTLGQYVQTARQSRASCASWKTRSCVTPWILSNHPERSSQTSCQSGLSRNKV